METSQEERDRIRREIDGHGCNAIAVGTVLPLLNDADRLAKLEDGIRALVNEIEPDDSVPHWVFRRIESLLGGGE